MSTANPHNLGPVPQFDERGRQVFEVQPALNTRRQGTRQAEEQSWKDPAISSGMVQGTDESDRQTASTPYAVKVATGRGRYGAGNPAPTWDQIDDQTKAGFSQGVGPESGRATPYPWQPRDGANYDHISPLHAMHRGERQNTAYGRKTAPEGAGRNRRNPADVSDL